MKRGLLIAAALFCLPSTGAAKVYLTKADALALAFPAATTVGKKTLFLDDEQLDAVRREAKADVKERIWTYYVGSSSGRILGYVYFDRVVVRTMPAVLTAHVDSEGRLRFLEVMSFEEPEDYLPRKRWLGLFADKGLGDDLRVRGAIRNVSGATLTSEALTRSARRMLAVHGAARRSGLRAHEEKK